MRTEKNSKIPLKKGFLKNCEALTFYLSDQSGWKSCKRLRSINQGEIFFLGFYFCPVFFYPNFYFFPLILSFFPFYFFSAYFLIFPMLFFSAYFSHFFSVIFKYIFEFFKIFGRGSKRGCRGFASARRRLPPAGPPGRANQEGRAFLNHTGSLRNVRFLSGAGHSKARDTCSIRDYCFYRLC